MTQAKKLRIITFNFIPHAYNLVTACIKDAGHKHVLTITTPGPKSRPTPSYKTIIDSAPRDVEFLVTTRLRTVATPVIRSLKPDLIVCMSFPYRITPEICDIPTYGAINVHPAVLPAYRGPNGMRPFYDGAEVFGATAHWIDEDFDTGKILSRKSAKMPELMEEETFSVWSDLISQAITEGMEKAIAGEVGKEQDDSKASYAALFSEEEYWIDWNEAHNVITRKVLALNGLRAGIAKTKIGDDVFHIYTLELLDQLEGNNFSISECLERNEDSLIIQALDGPVRIHIS